MEKELVNKLTYLFKKKKSLLEICKELELKDYEVIGLVELMKQDGELVDFVNVRHFETVVETDFNVFCFAKNCFAVWCDDSVGCEFASVCELTVWECSV